MSFSKWRGSSCARSEIRRDVHLDVKTLTSVALRTRRGRKKCSSRKLWRLFHQSNQGWGVLRDADDLDLVTLDPQFRHISTVGQRLRKGLHHDDARWSRLLALRQKAQGRSAGIQVETQRCTPFRNPAHQLLLLEIQSTPDVSRSDQGGRSRKTGEQQHDAQNARHIYRPPDRSPQRLVKDLD